MSKKGKSNTSSQNSSPLVYSTNPDYMLPKEEESVITLAPADQLLRVTLETALKHSAASTFKLAALEIENETHFTITVPALTAQKFVEQERMNVLEKVWEHFHNRAIQFSILVAASEKEDVPLHLSLNSKQKYERIAAQYPLVQELKTRLNLEIYY